MISQYKYIRIKYIQVTSLPTQGDLDALRVIRYSDTDTRPPPERRTNGTVEKCFSGSGRLLLNRGRRKSTRPTLNRPNHSDRRVSYRYQTGGGRIRCETSARTARPKGTPALRREVTARNFMRDTTKTLQVWGWRTADIQERHNRMKIEKKSMKKLKTRKKGKIAVQQ